MAARLVLFFLGVLFVTSMGCAERVPPRELAQFSRTMLTFCCEPVGSRQSAGTFTITDLADLALRAEPLQGTQGDNFSVNGSAEFSPLSIRIKGVNGPLQFMVAGAPFDPASDEHVQRGPTTIEVIVDPCEPKDYCFTVELETIESPPVPFAPPLFVIAEQKIIVKHDCGGTTPPPLTSVAAALHNLITNGTDGEMKILEVTIDLFGFRITIHTSITVPSKGNDTDPRTRIIEGGLRVDWLGTDQLTDAFNNTDFPPGQGPNGFTVVADPTVQLAEDDYFIGFIVLEGNVPLNDPLRCYQYGFVFDADGNPNNNYVPDPAFANDFFRDTDRWYAAEYCPETGWTVNVTDARDNNFQTFPSGARVIIKDNVLMLVVPKSEFGVEDPAYRYTAFCHDGTFGLNPPFDWSGDLFPAVADPLLSGPYDDRLR